MKLLFGLVAAFLDISCVSCGDAYYDISQRYNTTYGPPSNPFLPSTMQPHFPVPIFGGCRYGHSTEVDKWEYSSLFSRRGSDDAAVQTRDSSCPEPHWAVKALGVFSILFSMAVIIALLIIRK